jgi:5-oxoprolinase (ATP-hydrolysing)
VGTVEPLRLARVLGFAATAKENIAPARAMRGASTVPPDNPTILPGMHSGAWHIWIDTGGTFTDCIAIDPRTGVARRIKVLSSGVIPARIEEVMDASTVRVEGLPVCAHGFFDGYECSSIGSVGLNVKARVQADRAGGVLQLAQGASERVSRGAILSLRSGEEAPLLAARIATGTPLRQPLPPIDMRLATTRAINALLERRGGRVALFVTRGFRDLLLIGDQTRPELFSLTARRPPPLYEQVVEVDERLNADGTILIPLDEAAVRAAANEARRAGISIAAIALLHADINSAHEERVEAILREEGFAHVSRSSAVAPFIKILHRAETAVANAFVAPALEKYVSRVSATLSDSGESRLRLLTSAGGVVDAGEAWPKDCLLSGPAGGVVGAARAGTLSGFDRIIGFDMGGTSTDVCRHSRDFEYRFEQRVGDARIMSPALAIETVAAGGGSICAWRHGRLVVGPESAGADPGPACYGRGGPLTITDVNLLLGRLDAGRFEIPIDPWESERALNEVCRAMSAEIERLPSREELLEGFLAIADERMADAIARVSSRRGFDPREHAMVAFGGAGGQHACRVAERLGIETVLFPRDASLLSAAGVGMARIERFAERQVLRALRLLEPDFSGIVASLEGEAIDAVARQGEDPRQVRITRRIASARIAGQDATLEIEFSGFNDVAGQFLAAYRRQYGHDAPTGGDREIEIDSMRIVAAACAAEDHPLPNGPLVEAEPASASAAQRCFIGGSWRETPVHQRHRLETGAAVEGPALIVDRGTTIFLDGGWRAQLDRAQALVATRRNNELRAAGARSGAGAFQQSGIVERDLFAARLTAIAEQMGEMLERTAISTNVKERRDFSCALLDAEGRLLVNAPHIPVHLGSLGVCVRAVREAIQLGPGDVVVTNHPAFGGSHLPDVTVITAAFDDSGRLIGYTASRAHHAEFGGTRPGSMPPDATNLEQEGVVIRPIHLVNRGDSRFDAIERLLKGARHPSRQVSDNLADMRAQVAANNLGAESLGAVARKLGAAAFDSRVGELHGFAASLAARAIARLRFDECAAQDEMDDGSPIGLRITRKGERLEIDFAGSGGVHSGNLNATPAIVHSAVIYVLRVLIGEGLPLNDGIMRQVSIDIPRGMLNPEFPVDDAKCPAVVGGNTEVSQRIVDVLFRALGMCAASQGTMNNVLFGNERMGYYETVCGGGGAEPGYDGADAIQCHMTNTRMTDPEILERHYPVRLDRFQVRRGSGGRGTHRGGDGVHREMTFLAPLSLSVLSQRRTIAPFGLQGGKPGQVGKQTVIRADGSMMVLKSIDGCDVSIGDRLVLETPGGGGWGSTPG